MEYKITSKEENLINAAKKTLDQIEEKGYISKIKAYKNVEKIISLGLAFYGKQVEVAFK
ncbi:MAG: PD-(D/E)XK nuclease domain-containing protein [Proteobacteria bacterium]|nr:PD-(D/E)XK nuclease domain-containing protein [Pseudomonadota bacterium]